MTTIWKIRILLLLVLRRISSATASTNCTSFKLTEASTRYLLQPMKPLPVIPGQPMHLFSLFQHHHQDQCAPFQLALSDSTFDLSASCSDRVLFRIVYDRKANAVLCTGYGPRSAGDSQDCGFQNSVQLTTIDRDWLFLEDLSMDVPRGSWVLFRMGELDGAAEELQKGCDCEKIVALADGIGACENDLDHLVQAKTLFFQRLLAGTIGFGVVLGISVFALRGVYAI